MDDIIIQHVCKLAKIHDSTVFLTHVVHSHTFDQDRFLREKTTAYMADKEKIFKAEDIPVRVIILSGEPERELLHELDEGDYDLIAMATHGHNFFLDLLFGSVSDHLKHKTSIPLLLIKA
ncbi:MAG: universal stress protein [Spirochaetales bacterium]|nr:universal stress protein [Spirochaetales bacterium]